MVELNLSGTYTQVLYGPGGEKLALMVGQSLQKAFIALPSGTAVYTTSGLAYYRHSDWLGSSRFASTTGRSMYSSSAYAPFGEQYANAGTNDQNFTGQQPDTAAGLYDFLFRRLSQTQGRWISPDPSGLGAVDPTAPQSWNRYAYVQNTPLEFIDVLGLDEAAPSWDCYSYAACEIFVSGSGFVGGWVPDTWSAGGCQDIYSDGNYVGNTCGGRQQQASQSTGDAKPTNTANSDRSGYESLFCLGDALKKNALSVALDAIGLIPEAEGFTKLFENTAGYQLARAVGNSAGYRGVVATQYGMKAVAQGKGAVAMVGGALGLGDTSIEGRISTGATVAGFIPGLGTAAAAVSLGVDAHKIYKDQSECVDSGKYD